MNLPFTQTQFLDLFAAYNAAIWPAQAVMYLLGALAVGGLFMRSLRWGNVILFVLAAMWLWVGVVYQLGFFTRLNPAATLFGAFFAFQGIIFLVNAITKRRLHFGVAATGYDIAGGAMIAYAALVYPALGMLLGHGWPHALMFGVAPCPVVVFTFGMLLFLRGRIAPVIVFVPLLWSLIGAVAALWLGMYEDVGLAVAGVTGTAMIIARNRRLKARASGA